MRMRVASITKPIGAVPPVVATSTIRPAVVARNRSGARRQAGAVADVDVEVERARLARLGRLESAMPSDLGGGVGSVVPVAFQTLPSFLM
jgi:hypothetical protein